ncbi:tRNA (adenosine(37)-N6)-threonylcarbamoyltransferase complex ATPase subunit type 1 TsaE [Agrococcus terreus]|uniref:tRNA (adenosine(37)-N6)-threonylcarbamoyltransferase complex ATPase subunit type 1 TsaE n=1 Tax=Agrococcus terreus TaxID=574649 RepID=UPI00384BD32C
MRVEVDPAAIAANVALLRERVGVPVCGVVKADGYGHGAVLAARAMLEGGASMLGVVDLAEAVALRDAGIDAPVLAWLHAPGVDLRIAAERGVDVAVSSMAQLEAAAEAGAAIHLKLDTGLGRNGVARGDRAEVLARAAALAAGGARVRGVMSHLAGTSREADRAQVADLLAAVGLADLGPVVRHIANSAGAIALPEARLDMVRIGMAAYGVDPEGPSGGRGAAELGLRPAMRVVVDLAGGRADAGLDAGLLPAVGAPLVVGSRRARVLAVDPCGLQAQPLDRSALPLEGEAVLWGDPARGEPSVDDWAEAAGTIGYEVVTRMSAAARGARVVRPAEGLAPRRALELGLDGEPRRLLGELVGVKRVEGGLGVSYGGTYVTAAPTTLALVGLGYADGVTRGATGRPVVLDGASHPIRGRVAMDQLVLDLGGGDAAVGDAVAIEHASAPELTGMIGPRVAVELAGTVHDADAMEALGERIGAALVAGDAVLLVGPLGAGKTTLTRGIGRALGAKGTVQSPTFVIARTHRTAAGPDLQHVDAYRLGDEAELDDLDLDLEGAITVAEWGAPLEHALESRLLVEIARGSDPDADDDEDSPREVRISGRGPAWDGARMRALARGGAS